MTNQGGKLLLMKRLLFILLLILLLSSLSFAGDPKERGFLKVGMTESEVILKVGKPDYTSTHKEYFQGILKTVKILTYYPHPQDQQTITIVTIENGRVTNVERKVSYDNP